MARFVSVTYGQTLGRPNYSSERTEITIDVAVPGGADVDECLKKARIAHKKLRREVEKLTGRSWKRRSVNSSSKTSKRG